MNKRNPCVLGINITVAHFAFQPSYVDKIQANKIHVHIINIIFSQKKPHMILESLNLAAYFSSQEKQNPRWHASPKKLSFTNIVHLFCCITSFSNQFLKYFRIINSRTWRSTSHFNVVQKIFFKPAFTDQKNLTTYVTSFTFCKSSYKVLNFSFKVCWAYQYKTNILIVDPHIQEPFYTKHRIRSMK